MEYFFKVKTSIYIEQKNMSIYNMIRLEKMHCIYL